MIMVLCPNRESPDGASLAKSLRRHLREMQEALPIMREELRGWKALLRDDLRRNGMASWPIRIGAADALLDLQYCETALQSIPEMIAEAEAIQRR
jgi:hypothetical protein